MLDVIRTLSNLDGVSGREDAVREYIISQIQGIAEYQIDAMGNLKVFKKGAATPANKVMLAAHMDEVGLIINYITDDGYLRFHTVGGIDAKVLLGRTVRINEKTLGVLGVVPIHLLKDDELKTVPSIDKMYIDIGTTSKEEALQHVRLGDVAVFNSDFTEFGCDLLKGKAIDDRAGCAILLDMIKSDLKYDMHFAFTVQEEVGLRGAGVAAYGIDPDYAIVVEATTAADIAGVEPHKQVCKLGEGAVVSFMDKATVYNRTLYDLAFTLAEKNNIKCQPKTVVAGGNDAGAIHSTREGIQTISISLPCRYLHSANCVINKNDLDDVKHLAIVMAEEFANAQTR